MNQHVWGTVSRLRAVYTAKQYEKLLINILISVIWRKKYEQDEKCCVSLVIFSILKKSEFLTFNKLLKFNKSHEMSDNVLA